MSGWFDYLKRWSTKNERKAAACLAAALVIAGTTTTITLLAHTRVVFLVGLITAGALMVTAQHLVLRPGGSIPPRDDKDSIRIAPSLGWAEYRARTEPDPNHPADRDCD